MTARPAQLDTAVAIVTPENIAFEYRIAGPFRRLPAYLIDLMIRILFAFGVMFVAGIAFGVIGLEGLAIAGALIVWFLLEWFYGGFFEAVFNGQTPGKRVMQLRVLTVEGHPIAGWQAILRNFLRAADALPVVPMPTYLVGLAAATMNDRYQRLGDIAAGTMVVVERRRREHGVARVDDPEAIALAASLPADLRIDRHLAQALSTYVERRGALGQARRDEIAAHLARPFIARNALSPDLPPDALLAALYYRAFIADRPDEDANVRARNRRAVERSNFETAIAAIGSDEKVND